MTKENINIVKAIEYTTGINSEIVEEVFKSLQTFNLLKCMENPQEDNDEYEFEIPYFGKLYCKYKGTSDYKKKPIAVVDTSFKPSICFLENLDNAVNEDTSFSNNLEKQILNNIDSIFEK